MEKSQLIEIITKLQATGQEWDTVDAKKELILKEIGDKAEFVKDVVAMANNGEPSFLIIGLEDNTFIPVGEISHLYRKNDINQILVDKIDPPLVVGYQEFKIDENEYAVIEIHGSNPPYIVGRDLVHKKTDRKRVRVHKGSIYVRHNDRTEGISRFELEKYFNNEIRKAFQNETEYALKLAFKHSEHWEHLLIAELLQGKLAKIRRDFSDLERGLIYRKSVNMKSDEFLSWLIARCNDFCALITLLGVAVTEEIPMSCGEVGESGDPLEIQRAVNRIADACNNLLEWEIDFRTVIPPDSFKHLKGMMFGWTLGTFEQIESIPQQILNVFEKDNLEGQHTISIEFSSPSNFEECRIELDLFSQHAELLLSSYS